MAAKEDRSLLGLKPLPGNGFLFLGFVFLMVWVWLLCCFSLVCVSGLFVFDFFLGNGICVVMCLFLLFPSEIPRVHHWFCFARCFLTFGSTTKPFSG